MNALSNKEPEETVKIFSSKRRSNDRYGDDSEKRVKLTKAAVEATIRQASLESAISTTDQLGQDVSMETHLSRCELTRSLLTSGIAVRKADSLRAFFQKWLAVESTDSSELLQYCLPTIQDEELKLIKRETAGRSLSVSFDAKADGSSGYRLCVIVGFVDDTMRIQQRVINLGLFKENCEEILSTKMSDNIIHAITEVLQAPCKSIKVLCHYVVHRNELCMLKLTGGAFNNRASDTKILIKGHYFKALDISCILQSLDKCADLEFDDPSERMDGRYAKTVYDQIDGYFSSATDVTKKSWESFSGSSMPSLSRTERWSKENFYAYILPFIKLGRKPSKDPSFNAWIHKNVASLRSLNGFVGSCLFGLEQSFVTTHIDFSEIVIVTACVEIAVVVDVTQSVRDAADIIKREGPVVILLAEILQSVDAYYTSACENMSFPNVRKYVDYAISQRFSPPDHILPQFDKHDGGAVMKELEKAWKEYYLELTVSFMNNFDTTIMDNSCFPHWRAASMADPLNMQRGKVTLGDLRNRLEPLKDNMVSDELIRRMEDELPAYAKACSSLEWSNYTHVERLDKIEEFWCKHTCHLPSWTEFVSLVLLLQPTVRCVDKFHATLDEVIKEEETKPAEYHLEAAVTLRYNRGSSMNAAY